MEQRTLRAMQELARLLIDDADKPSQNEIHARLKGFQLHESGQRRPRTDERDAPSPVSPWNTYDDPGWPTKHEVRISRLSAGHEDTKRRLDALQNQFEGLEKRDNTHADRLFELEDVRIPKLEQDHENTKQRLAKLERYHEAVNIEDPAEVQETRRKLVYIIDSIVGGLDSYQGILKWLNMHTTLDEAYKAAEKEREGMIAT